MSDDLRTLLRTAAAEPREDFDVTDLRARGRRLARRRRVAVAASVAVVVMLVAVGAIQLVQAGSGPQIVDQPPPPPADAQLDPGWHRLPEAPLEPRQYPNVFWAGERLLVIGGSSADPCPPGASCTGADRPPHRNGAAYDPAVGRWQPIAEAPVPIGHANGAVLDRTLYLWAPEFDGATQRAFLAYHIDGDRWERLPIPDGVPELTSLRLEATDDAIVAYPRTHEPQVQPDRIYDPAGRTWSQLPADPLSPDYDRSMVWTGNQLVLLAIPIDEGAQPNSTRPSLYETASWNPGDDAWTALPPSQVVSWDSSWFWVGDRIVNPSLGSADGGDTNPWDRPYPFGGMFDPASNTWSDLPDAPTPAGGYELESSVAGRDIVVSSDGWALHVPTGQWARLEQPPGAPDEATGTAWGDGRVYVWGGVRWDDQGGELLGDGWAWTPPAFDQQQADPPLKCAPPPPSANVTTALDGNGWTLPVAQGETTAVEVTVDVADDVRIDELRFVIRPADSYGTVSWSESVASDLEPGLHRLTAAWDGTSVEGDPVPPGRYHLSAELEATTTAAGPSGTCARQPGQTSHEGFGLGYFQVDD